MRDVDMSVVADDVLAEVDTVFASERLPVVGLPVVMICVSDAVYERAVKELALWLPAGHRLA